MEVKIISGLRIFDQNRLQEGKLHTTDQDKFQLANNIEKMKFEGIYGTLKKKRN